MLLVDTTIAIITEVFAIANIVAVAVSLHVNCYTVVEPTVASELLSAVILKLQLLECLLHVALRSWSRVGCSS